MAVTLRVVRKQDRVVGAANDAVARKVTGCGEVRLRCSPVRTVVGTRQVPDLRLGLTRISRRLRRDMRDQLGRQSAKKCKWSEGALLTQDSGATGLVSEAL